MKFIFAGPTLHGTKVETSQSWEMRPPARQGDIHAAVQDGATVIGLIDGLYEYVPAVWHKEILYGLSKGLSIFGAASMGALRAAECRQFGMVGIGKIYNAYVDGSRQDDADVAQSHGPEETGYLPLSEPLVNVEATLSRCLALKLVSGAEHDQLLTAARDMFFKDRTYRRIVRKGVADPMRAAAILIAVRSNSVNLKLEDALLLIDAVNLAADERIAPPGDWDFHATGFWKSCLP